MDEDTYARPIVLLDACVLFPASLRDALLNAAEAQFYDPLWSDDILDEVARNLIGKRKVTSAGVNRLLQAIRTAFPAATLDPSTYVHLIPAMTTDPGDQHVAAAAIIGEASMIVTFNINHFPVTALMPYQIRVVTPDQFFLALLTSNIDKLRNVFLQQAAMLQHPPKTYEELLDTLTQHIPHTVVQLRRVGYSPNP